jgi:hypothetical protein
VWVYQQLNQPASSKPVIVATTMQALALVLLGRANEAEKLATDCLEAARHMSGPAAERNSFVASCHNCLGEVLREMGRLNDAEAAAREGLAMREKVRCCRASLLFVTWMWDDVLHARAWLCKQKCGCQRENVSCA